MNPKIGVYSDSYPDKRMILNKVPDCEYIQVQNRRENWGRILRLLGKGFPGFQQSEIYAQGVHFTLDTPYCPEADVIHSFNRVCLGARNRWVATFEKTFPEYFSDEEEHLPARIIKKQIPLIASQQCIALLPMSQWAYEYEMRLVGQYATHADRKIIEDKMEVLYPPQAVLSSDDEIREKYGQKGRLHLFFVGGQLKRKGGVELIKVLNELHKECDSFSAVIVGDLNNEYCNFRVSSKEKQEIENIIDKADWLEYHQSLSNDEILKCAKTAHIGFLPTMGDTFGFSLLEMQACGCPVVSTDRQALPEINHDDCGWVLDTRDASNSHGDDFAHYSVEDVQELSKIIQKNLKKAMTEILNHPGMIEEKAHCALDRIKKEHDQEQYASDLLRIYRKCKQDQV